MLRKTLTILSLIGLMLSVGLWGVSCFWIWYGWEHWGGRQAVVIGGEQMFVVQTLGVNRGCVEYEHFAMPHSEIGPTLGFHSWFTGYNLRWTPEWWRSPRRLQIFLPLWIPAILFALVLYLTRPIYHHRRRKRKKLGLCLKCGYDLRASKDRCPECGATIKR